ncbi:hypothetical protein LTSEMIS_4494, partial [Salmonella enterica subsp. enterica serovar Mississippi str. A4-633]
MFWVEVLILLSRRFLLSLCRMAAPPYPAYC